MSRFYLLCLKNRSRESFTRPSRIDGQTKKSMSFGNLRVVFWVAKNCGRFSAEWDGPTTTWCILGEGINYKELKGGLGWFVFFLKVTQYTQCFWSFTCQGSSTKLKKGSKTCLLQGRGALQGRGHRRQLTKDLQQNKEGKHLKKRILEMHGLRKKTIYNICVLTCPFGWFFWKFI